MKYILILFIFVMSNFILFIEIVMGELMLFLWNIDILWLYC